MKTQPTAAILIIGNEILSGRTQDKNTHWIAGKLAEIGIRLVEVRVIADDRQTIIHTVRALHHLYDYLFTTGGIGPTHDDITSEAVAACFDAPLVLNPEAHDILKKHYGGNLNEARLKMAYIPEGAALIPNPVSAAPGFHIQNVYVMAGIPTVMQAMFDHIRHDLKGGMPTLSITVSATTTEGLIATELTAIQRTHAEVDIGSYPFIKNGRLGVSIVLRGLDASIIEKAAHDVRALLASKGELLEA